MPIDLPSLEAYLHAQIPITRAMGVRVVSYDGGEFVLKAPLDVNHNHLGTAFGGSLAAIATLAGYGLLWLELDDPKCHVVVRESAISYRRPVRETIRAGCRRPDEAVMAAFRAAFLERGKARLPLAVTIEAEGAIAVEFSGVFVAVVAVG